MVTLLLKSSKLWDFWCHWSSVCSGAALSAIVQHVHRVSINLSVTVGFVELLGLVAFSLQMEHGAKMDRNLEKKGLLQSDELHQVTTPFPQLSLRLFLIKFVKSCFLTMSM